ncbi:MAG: energy transducer TonB [Bacteroidales bacterium]|nr:energy transducer TonB [Bacteroides sp.]NLI64406.1 energy transducer TonB [Bacteroidales bacterium]
MEIKKTPKADLENKKSTWLLIGYVIVLAFMFIAFEWTQRDIVIDTSQGIVDIVFEEEIIPITQQQPEQAPPPPPEVIEEAPQVAEVLNIVEDDADIKDTRLASSEETGEKISVGKYVPVAVEVVEEPVEEEIFEVVEEMPEFPGGPAAMMKYLNNNIRYPTIAQENGIEGRVIVQFVVNSDGTIVDANVVRSVDPFLDKEALRVINSMPKWKPGKQRGKSVRVKYTLPVMFRLQ